MGLGGQRGRRQLPRLQVGEVPVLGQEIPGFADGPHQGGLDPGAGALPHRLDGVVRIVQAGAGQVVHARVHDDKVLGIAGLGVEDPGHQDAGVPHQHPARLQDQGQVQALQSL